jgi:hypothetical protein
MVKEGNKRKDGIRLMKKSLKMNGGMTSAHLTILGELLMRDGESSTLDEAIQYL